MRSDVSCFKRVDEYALAVKSSCVADATSGVSTCFRFFRPRPRCCCSFVDSSVSVSIKFVAVAFVAAGSSVGIMSVVAASVLVVAGVSITSSEGVSVTTTVGKDGSKPYLSTRFLTRGVDLGVKPVVGGVGLE